MAENNASGFPAEFGHEAGSSVVAKLGWRPRRAVGAAAGSLDGGPKRLAVIGAALAPGAEKRAFDGEPRGEDHLGLGTEQNHSAFVVVASLVLGNLIGPNLPE